MTIAVQLFRIYFSRPQYFFYSGFPSFGKFRSCHSPLTFLQTQRGMPLFTARLITFLLLIVTVFTIFRMIFHWRISLNSMFLLLLLNCVRGSRFELMYISHHKYQAKLHLSPWFSDVYGCGYSS